ncbi:MAG TPA: hypothetical protein VGM41_08345 [Chitinophagaceae bacterium]|jgi:hypothetical protein
MSYNTFCRLLGLYHLRRFSLYNKRFSGFPGSYAEFRLAQLDKEIELVLADFDISELTGILKIPGNRWEFTNGFKKYD